MNIRHLVCPFLLFFFSLTLVLGCGSKRPAAAAISGRVTYNGAPVSGGNLTFHSEAGVYSTALGTDGSYTATDLPEGDLVVTIETETLNPARKVPTYDAKSAGAGAKSSQYGKAASATPSPKGAGKDTVTKSPSGPTDKQNEVGQYVKIPMKYSEKKNSPLKVTMTSGSQTHNFELSD